MSDRSAGMKRLLWRIGVTLTLAAIVTDRVALYGWGHSVIGLYRWFCVPNPNANANGGLRPPMLGFGKDEGGFCSANVFLYGSTVRPDAVRLDRTTRSSSDCTLSLLFLPPRLAWSTRLFPGGRAGWPSAFYYGYELRLTDPGRPGRGECRLYRAVYNDRTVVPPDSRWPHFY
jgi:hypothetical protein